jgi:hypothetical protein
MNTPYGEQCHALKDRHVERNAGFGILIWFSRDQFGGVYYFMVFYLEIQRYPMTTMGAITFIFA